MNDKEREAFRAAFEFYSKWRDTVMETDEQWEKFEDDVKAYLKEQDVEHCPLAWRLINAVLETFNDLYRDGMKPLPADYFGRDDLST